MNRLVKIKLILLLLLGAASAQSNAHDGIRKGDLIVRVENVDKTGGKLYVAIFRDKDSFLKKEYLLKEISPGINETYIEVIFEDLPHNTYAISVFHDLNDNGELDTRLGFIPREPFGFSDAGRLIIGPPTFRGCSFEFGKNKQSVIVPLRKL